MDAQWTPQQQPAVAAGRWPGAGGLSRRPDARMAELPTPVAPAEAERLVVQHLGLLRAWLRLQVGDGSSLDDLVQDVSSALWEAMGEYDPSRPFAAWMLGFARIHVCRWRDRRRRGDRLLPIDDETVAVVAELAAELPAEEGLRFALAGCLADMDARGMAVIGWRFRDGLGLDAIAERSGISVSAASRRLAQLLRRLEECIRRRLGGGHA